jgi:hypothetical protein
MRYLVRMTFEVVDVQAEELNAAVLGRETTPPVSGGYTNWVYADDERDALTQALESATDLLAR